MRRLTRRFKKWLVRRGYYQARKGSVAQRKRPFFLRIPTPENLSFTYNRDVTQKFFQNMRTEIDVAISERRRLMVDPAPIKSINPAAALCLLAEFDRWQRLWGVGRLRPVTLRTWHQPVVRRLSDMGFFELLKTPVPEALRSGGPGANRFIRFVTDVVADTQHSVTFRREVGAPLSETSQLSLTLYRSLCEAIANAVEHAYPNPTTFPDRVGKRWWLMGSVDTDQNRLRVVVLDHGISIPGSLPNSRRWPEISKLIQIFTGEPTDGALIEAAMEYGRSRLETPQRGKGLGDIIALSDASPQNRLRIFSRNGYYVRTNGLSHSGVSRYPINGTLIEWDLALSLTHDDDIRPRD